MKISNINQRNNTQLKKSDEIKGTEDIKYKEIKTKITKNDEFIKSNTLNNNLEIYSNKTLAHGNTFDKGTAIETTVHISRSAFDKIVNETTFGDTNWDELGVDDNKRWVVVNGQRFEVEHSEAEKALRRNARKTLIDYLEESEEKMRKLKETKDNGPGKPKGNIEALKNNKEVMTLLGKIFNVSGEEILGKLI